MADGFDRRKPARTARQHGYKSPLLGGRSVARSIVPEPRLHTSNMTQRFLILGMQRRELDEPALDEESRRQLAVRHGDHADFARLPDAARG